MTYITTMIDETCQVFLGFYSEEDCYLLRHSDTKSLKKKYARTNLLKYSCFYRIVDEWNSLPLEVHSACSVDMFKSNIIKFVILIIVNIVTNSARYQMLQFFLDITRILPLFLKNIIIMITLYKVIYFYTGSRNQGCS